MYGKKYYYRVLTDGDFGRLIFVDKHSLDETATILAKINPYYTKEGYIEKIQQHIRECAKKVSFFGTLGYYVSCFDNDKGDRIAMTTLMPYTVERYLKQKAI